MTKPIALLICALLLSLTSFEQKVDPKKAPFVYYRDFQRILDSAKVDSSRFNYNKLLPKFLSNDTTLTNEEMLALMIGYTENPQFKPLEDMAKEKEIFELVQASKFDEAIYESTNFLATHPFNFMTLHQITIAYNAIKQKDSAAYYMKQHMKIMDAMIYSGTGETPETAIFSLGLADGERFISNIDFILEKRTTDWDKRDNFMEIIQAADTKAVSQVFYFVIQHAKALIDDDKANAEPSKSKKSKSIKKKKSKDDKKVKKVTSVSAINTNINSTDSSSISVDSLHQNTNANSLESSFQKDTVNHIYYDSSKSENLQYLDTTNNKIEPTIIVPNNSDTTAVNNIPTDSTNQNSIISNIPQNSTEPTNQQTQDNSQPAKTILPKQGRRKRLKS